MKRLEGFKYEHMQEKISKTHNLIYLLKLCKAKLSESQIRFITRLNTAAVATRYPDELKMLIEQYPPSVAEEYLKNAKDVIECMKQQVS